MAHKVEALHRRAELTTQAQTKACYLECISKGVGSTAQLAERHSCFKNCVKARNEALTFFAKRGWEMVEAEWGAQVDAALGGGIPEGPEAPSPVPSQPPI